MKDGIINIYKEKGYTSFDVIAILRKKLHMKRLGHTGTLDPDAEGVLPVCVGKATRVADYIADKTKVYLATFQLGAETDTQDHTGQVLRTSDLVPEDSQIRSAILTFIGDYDQVPPMYSALKINGQKLYDLARAGQTVERKSRRIRIENIEDILIDFPNVSMRVTCSKGTYIRTLCHDIGEKLGCFAHMTSLVRERTGGFVLGDALKLSQVEALVVENRIEDFILPVDSVFEHYEKRIVTEAFYKWLLNGNVLRDEMVTQTVGLHEKYRLYDEEGRFMGLYECVSKENALFLKPIILFI